MVVVDDVAVDAINEIFDLVGDDVAVDAINEIFDFTSPKSYKFE